MPEVNLVVLVGRAGTDAELKTVGDQEVASFPLATHRSYRAKSNKTETPTDWHTVDIWGPLAQGAAKHIKRGKLVSITGRLRTRWVEHQGKAFRVATVVADRFDTTPERAGSGEDAGGETATDEPAEDGTG